MYRMPCCARSTAILLLGLISVLFVTVAVDGFSFRKVSTSSSLAELSSSIPASSEGPRQERCGANRKKIHQDGARVACQTLHSELCKCSEGMCCNGFGFCGKGELYCSKKWGCNWLWGNCGFPREADHEISGPAARKKKEAATFAPVIEKMISASCENCDAVGAGAILSALSKSTGQKAAASKIEPETSMRVGSAVDEGAPPNPSCPGDVKQKPIALQPAPSKPTCVTSMAGDVDLRKPQENLWAPRSVPTIVASRI